MCTRCGTLLAHAVSLAPKEETKHSPAGSRRHGLARIRGQTKYESRANQGIWLTGEWSCRVLFVTRKPSLEYVFI
jgi:hypothetical protein